MLTNRIIYTIYHIDIILGRENRGYGAGFLIIDSSDGRVDGEKKERKKCYSSIAQCKQHDTNITML